MGTIESRSITHSEAYRTYGEIYLQLTNNIRSFSPGDSVSGVIYLDLKKDYPGDSLFLEFKCKQALEFNGVEFKSDRRGTSPNSSPVKNSRKSTYQRSNESPIDKRGLKSTTLLVYQSPDEKVIKSGQYSFPFTFNLPNLLNGSFYFAHSGTFSEIKYKLHAFLEPGVISNQPQPKLKYKEKIVIQEVNLFPDPIIFDINTKLMFCCCIDRGNINMKVHLEKKSFILGERLKIGIEIDNLFGKMDVKSIILKLKMHVLFKRDKHHKKRFYFVVREDAIRGPKSGESWTNENKKIISLELPFCENGVMNTIQKKDISLLPKLEKAPIELPPSATGKYLSCQYILDVYCLMATHFSNHGPNVIIPIQLRSPNCIGGTVPQFPPNWRPQIFDMVDLILPKGSPTKRRSPTEDSSPLKMREVPMDEDLDGQVQ